MHEFDLEGLSVELGGGNTLLQIVWQFVRVYIHVSIPLVEELNWCVQLVKLNDLLSRKRQLFQLSLRV